jgi:hypothetical protein
MGGIGRMGLGAQNGINETNGKFLAAQNLKK